MDQETGRIIDLIMEDNLHTAFEKIEAKVLGNALKPSDVERYLNSYWDLGGFFRDWWETGDEPWE